MRHRSSFRDIDDDGLVNQHQVSPPSKRGRHKLQRTVTPPVCSEIRVLDPNRPLVATSSSASEENMMDGQYHEAGVFEHVAKMSRLADSPRKKPSLLQVRHRSSVQPLNDLSSLPPVQKTPLVGPSPSGMETDQGPKSPDIVHEKPEDVEKTLRDRAEKERLRNKQRQREIIKEKENQALAAQQDGADPQQSKKDWSKVQSEIEAVLGMPENPQDQLKPTPVAKKRQEARALRWKKQPRPGSMDEDVNKRVGRNMRAVPRSSQSEPTSPSHKVPSPDRHKALTKGIVADGVDGPIQLVSYAHNEENLLKKMTQQMRDRQRVRDSHRAHQRVWSTAPPGGRYTTSEPAGSHGASPSASQVGSGPDSMPPHGSTNQSALERLFNQGTASGVYHTGAPPSGHHPHQATSAWVEPPGGDGENQKAIASQIVKSLSPEDRLALAKQLIQDLQAVR